MKKVLIFSCALLLAAASACWARGKAYTVERVIAGDIIRLTNGKIVRLIGIDTLDPQYDEEPEGIDQETIARIKEEAKQYLTDYINRLPDKKVYLEFDVEKKYKYVQSGRLLAYLFWDTGFVEGGPLDVIVEADQHFDYFGKKYMHFINATMVKQGYAIPLPLPPNIKYSELFDQLHKEAKEQRRGLWAGLKPSVKQEQLAEPPPLAKPEPLVELKPSAKPKSLAKPEPPPKPEPMAEPEPPVKPLVEVKQPVEPELIVEAHPKVEPKPLVKPKPPAQPKQATGPKPLKEEKEYYSDGTLKFHMVLYDIDNYQGAWKEYHENGSLKMDIPLLKVDGGCDEGSIPIEGTIWEYHQNGQLKQTGQYKDNCEEGVHQHYSSQGTLERELYYERGKLVRTKQYYANGKVFSEDYSDD